MDILTLALCKKQMMDFVNAMTDNGTIDTFKEALDFINDLSDLEFDILVETVNDIADNYVSQEQFETVIGDIDLALEGIIKNQEGYIALATIEPQLDEVIDLQEEYIEEGNNI